MPCFFTLSYSARSGFASAHALAGAFTVALALLAHSAAQANDHEGPEAPCPQIQETIRIDRIWSAARVRFCLRTHGDRQYIAYYNADRRMVVGMRALSDAAFVLHLLASRSEQPPTRENTSTVQGWDPHNYVTLAVDRAGHIHLAGNMHNNPLTYFRSQQPHDVTTMVQIDAMVGKNEQQCTYPKFKETPDGRLLFHYRDGGSGNGVEIYNVYDVATRQWQRFLDTPLISGEGRMNAYLRGPTLGPDGRYHLLWMWRNTPDAATNHSISYARSNDLKHWENAHGTPLPLPMTFNSPGTIIDPVPPGGGMINSNQRLAFDRQGQPIITYHKHDENGHTQAMVARFDHGQWNVRAVSDWQSTFRFSGIGPAMSTFGTSLRVQGVQHYGQDRLAVAYRHWIHGTGLIVLDHDTLQPIKTIATASATPQYPEEVTKVSSEFPGMVVYTAGDLGTPKEPNVNYVLRWEALGNARGRPHQGPWPQNSDLVLYKIKH